jgi:hypothetical protein
MRLCGTEGFSTSTSQKIEKIAEEVDEEKNHSAFSLCFAFRPLLSSRRATVEETTSDRHS